MKGKEKAWGWFTPSQDGGDEKKNHKTDSQAEVIIRDGADL